MESDTLVAAVNDALGVVIAERGSRFSEPGWALTEYAENSCPHGHSNGLAVFQKKYRNHNGKRFQYYALVCIDCAHAYTLKELGINSRGLTTVPVAPPVATAPMVGGVVVDLDAIALRDLLATAIHDANIDDRATHILEERTGASGHYGTLAELADQHGVTRERIRQIQQRASADVAATARMQPQSAARVLAAALHIATAEPFNHLDVATQVHRLIEELEPAAAATASSAILALTPMPKADQRVIAELISIAHTAAIKQPDQPESITPPQATLSRWLQRNTVWPTITRTDTATINITTQRTIRSSYRSGTITLNSVGQDVGYESRTERQFLSLVDRSDMVTGIVEQPAAISYHYRGGSHIYYPDFLLDLTDGRHVLVEVKYSLNIADARNVVKYAAAERYAHQHGWGFAVVCPNEPAVSLPDLREWQVSAATAQALETELSAHGYVDHQSLSRIMELTPVSAMEIPALALQRGWSISHGPFRITQP